MPHTNTKYERLGVHCKMCEICLLRAWPQAPAGDVSLGRAGGLPSPSPLPRNLDHSSYKTQLRAWSQQ